ncbi:MAG: valine--tRNA ligase [Pseudomonadota bacterium]
MLEKIFDPQSAEPRLYVAWEKAGAFRPDVNPDGAPYTIVIPPPNVTGSLHMGHALNNTLQDVLCRFERMRGRAVLWQPGTDHAGIATQMVVERQLNERQQKRTDFSRDEFIQKVWEWRHESGGAIINQLKRLGASCDWSRERFTMGDNGEPDDQMVRAVMKVFVDLYNGGLIYRAKRLVNWDPHFQTAISDLEVENKDVPGHMWHFKYPLAGGETYEYVEKDEDGNETLRETRDYISIATTRPETMLGDGAVAVHPKDERYAPIVGKLCEIPVGPKEHRRLIPIITDDYPDPEFGSGAVKITGAHDFNDYQVAKRGDIPMYRLMDWKGALRNDGQPYAEEAQKAQALLSETGTPDENYVDAINLVPDEYRGLDRFEARKRVVADIDADGLMIMVEDKKIMQPFGDRSGVVIEPMLTDQWFADAKTLAEPAIKAVEEGKTRFVPENWTKTYYQWMRNIEPWCISRQLWWGHRIPAWYGPDGHIYVAESEEEATKMAIAKYTQEGYSLEEINDMRRHEHGAAPLLHQDEDVLDTWFSSGLWPFSTLGWPDASEGEGDKANLVNKHYPTTVLVTAFDIIFFWVARMMMQGIHFMKDVPFHDVYIHALVLDEKGQKMSKSKGNVIDPLGLIDKYGADPLRFTLAAMAAQGRNIRLSEQRIEGYRNFSTKLWNAARFVEMNECAVDPDFDPSKANETLNKWIIHELRACVAETTEALEGYRFNDAAGAIYRFTWNTFCDWHLEFAKPILQGTDGPAKAETRAATAFVLDEILKLLHPFMPYITEELWGARADRDAHLIVTSWPTAAGLPLSEEAAAEMNSVIDLITEIRSVRQTVDLPAGEKFPMLYIEDGSAIGKCLATHSDLIERLARLDSVKTIAEADAPKGVALVSGGSTFVLDVAGSVDLAAVTKRLEKEVTKAEKEISVIDKKLGNPKFVDKAPQEVVDEQKERRAGYAEQREKLAAALTRLSG